MTGRRARARQARRVGAASAADTVPAHVGPRVCCAEAVPDAMEAASRLSSAYLCTVFELSASAAPYHHT